MVAFKCALTVLGASGRIVGLFSARLIGTLSIWIGGATPTTKINSGGCTRRSALGTQNWRRGTGTSVCSLALSSTVFDQLSRALR